MTIPNLLSVFRICLVPVFILLFFSGGEHAYPLAALVFVLAGVTDWLDGYLARKWNQITMLGRVLDPLGDKLMVFSALVCLAVKQLIPLWLALLYFVKELVQAVGGAILFHKIRDVPPANLFGKAATALFYASLALIILWRGLPYGYKALLLGVAFALVLAAFFSYLARALKLVKQQNPTGK